MIGSPRRVPQMPMGSPPVIGGAGFNPFAAGDKQYGTGQPMPTSGLVTDKLGYAQRDAAAAARKTALIRRATGGL